MAPYLLGTALFFFEETMSKIPFYVQVTFTQLSGDMLSQKMRWQADAIKFYHYWGPNTNSYSSIVCTSCNFETLEKLSEYITTYFPDAVLHVEGREPHNPEFRTQLMWAEEEEILKFGRK